VVFSLFLSLEFLKRTTRRSIHEHKDEIPRRAVAGRGDCRRPRQTAIEVFKQNATDFPQSSNVHDRLGKAYAVNGERNLAIRSYERSIELNPANTNGIEALKKLRESK
jgi:tetratricopeptide (TPR) repeat protein